MAAKALACFSSINAMASVNPQILNALQVTANATLSPSVIKAAGAGKAYQSVAQSAAIAVQDGADYLRNVSTISSTAIGIAMAQYAATQDAKYLEVIAAAQALVPVASQAFETIGQSAAAVVNAFPSG